MEDEMIDITEWDKEWIKRKRNGTLLIMKQDVEDNDKLTIVERSTFYLILENRLLLLGILEKML